MTTSIRGLVVDDLPEQVELIRSSLDLEFDVWDMKIDWTEADSAVNARKTVRESEPFDFAIVDYELGDNRPTGREVVVELRRRSEETFILVITGMANKYPTFMSQAKDAGANHAIIRSELDVDPNGEWTFARLANRIRRRALTRPGTRDRLEIRFANTLGVKSTLHLIGRPPSDDHPSAAAGERIVRDLAIAALQPEFRPGLTTLLVSHLAGGRSGAHVLRIDRERDQEGTGSFILKIGLDQQALDHERQRNQEAKQILPPEALVEIIGGLHVDDSGFAAIVARLAGRAITLRAWLTGTDPSATVEDARGAAEVLFGEHLAPLFEPGWRTLKPAQEWLTISAGLELRILHNVAAFREAWEHENGAHQPDVVDLAAVVTSFATDKRVPAVNRARANGHVPYVRSFGDLHTQNVLVQLGRHKRPVLVDASMFAPAHWALDAARLIVDIVLRVRGSATAAMLWYDFDSFRRYAATLCTVASTGVVDHDGTEAFVRQVLRELHRYAHVAELGMDPTTWHWQWHTALAKEFLRQGTDPEMAPPQAVLAMTAAADHLIRAAQLIDGIEDSGSGTNGTSPCAAYAPPEAD